MGVLFAAIFIFMTVGLYIGVPGFSDVRYEVGTSTAAVATTVPPVPQGRVATHVPVPDAVRGIYMTSCVAATPSLRDRLVALVDETELNAIVIDIKSFDGYVSFPLKDEPLKVAEGGCFVEGLQDFIDDLHSRGIFVIGRVAAFQDALMVKLHPDRAVKRATATSTVWRDHKGIPWIDASSREHWDYLVAIAKEAHGIGFDEVNFDYIRFPSDGNMNDIWYPWSGARKKSEVMREFYEYVHEQLSPTGLVLSADLFGMTTTNTDDLNIGQILEYALPNFDYIAPMVYPSHYPKGFMGFSDPNKHVYEIVKYSMDRAVARTVATTTAVPMRGGIVQAASTSTPALYAKEAYDKDKMRPWLQDNNYPVVYTAEMVRAQIKAAYDAGLDSWLLWNAGNRYTRAALEPAL